MGIFDKFRRRSEPLETDERLFGALAETVARGDSKAFESLCRAHVDRIVAAFPSWQKLDPDRRPSPEEIQAHVQVLGHTAQFLAEVLGRPEPWQRLTAPGDSPFERWEAKRAEAMQRAQALDYPGAVAITEALLEDLQGFSGTGRDQQEAYTRGLLGQLLRQTGRPDEAEPHLKWTLESCEADGDIEGVGLYLRQLHELDRDRGRPSRWIERLASHAETHGSAEDVARYRLVLQRFPQGEPPLRMVAQVGELRLELDQVRSELMPTGASANVVFVRNRETLAPAQKWTERGREHGGRGDHDEAIACFVAAAEADPHDPDSRYLHAFTLMITDRPELALPLYDEVERLAPGWFHVRTWRSLAQRRVAGELEHGVITVINALEDGGLTAEQRASVASQAIERWPKVPELHLYLGNALRELGGDADGAWRSGLELSGQLPATRSRLLQALGRLDEVLEVDGANSMVVAAARMQLALRR